MGWEYMTWVVEDGRTDLGEYYAHRGGQVRYVNGAEVADWKKRGPLDEWLRWAGAQGWELVNFHVPASGHGIQARERSNAFYVFKRSSVSAASVPSPAPS